MTTAERHISIIIEYRVPPENRAAFLERLERNCRETLSDDGCFRMEISEPIGGDGRTFFLTERWRDQAAIDRHREKPGHDQQHVEVDRLASDKRVAKCFVLNTSGEKS